MRPSIAFLFIGISLASAKEAPIRALLVCGGCCHDYASQAVILRDEIQKRANVQIDVIRSEDKGTKPWFPMYENKDWAKGYDVIIHDECAAEIKEMPYVQNIVDAHKNGVPGVNLHCAMHCYRTGTPLWFEYLGLQSSGHGWQKPIDVDFASVEHPITKGFANWTTIDEELYNNVKIFETAKPLALGSQMTADGKKDTTVVAWTNDYHGTRVFSTTLGHNNATVSDERYLNLVIHGLLWSCNKLNSDFLQPYTGSNGKFKTVPVKSPESFLGKPPEGATLARATASSKQDDNKPENAIDGREETRWCAGGGEFPQWLQLEFEKKQPLTGLEITWENKDNIYQYKIGASMDGKKWAVISNVGGNAVAGGTAVDFPKTEMKFLKITCNGTSKGGWASIREIIAKGDGIGPLFPKLAEAKEKKPADPFEKSGNTDPRIVKLSPEQESEILKDVKVADGFGLSLFANPAAANYPVYVAAAPNGDLYVSSDGNGSLDRDAGRGRVLRLRDTDKDGRADEVTEFIKNVESPRGLVWDHDRLYLVHPPDVSVYTDFNGDGQADDEKTLIKGIAFGFKDRPADHTTNGLSLGIDGWFYIAGGDFGFMDAVGADGKHLQHRGGSVIRFRPDGSGMEIFASGTRNILGTPISPLMDLFARDNTNDGGGWDVRFHHFTGLEDHGYPSMFRNFKDEIIKPLGDYGGGSGCGSVYLSEPGIPAKWNDAPLTCDWGTGALWHHTVVAKGATFEETAKPEQFIAMTRPTDADVDAMSHIYQASWKGATFKWEGPDVGYIIRVSPKGYASEPLPDFEKSSDAELIRLLESPSQVRTLEAQRALLRRNETTAMKQGLLALAGNANKPMPARVAALFALTQRATRSESAAAIISAVIPLAADEKLQRFVLRALSDAGLDEFPKGKTTAPETIYSAGLKSSDARTRLEAIVGATRQNMKTLGPQIAVLLGDADPVVAHTAFRSLSMMEIFAPCFAIVDNEKAPHDQRIGALHALMRIHQPDVVQGLIDRLARTRQTLAREELLSAICRLYFREGEWKGDAWGTRPDTRGPYYQLEAWSETPKITAVLKAELDKATPQEAPFLIRELRRNRIEFNETLERIMALAKDKPELLPEVVEQLGAKETVPTAGLPFLIQAAKSDGPPRMIAFTVSIFSRLDSDEGCVLSLVALEKLARMKGAGKQYDFARKTFLEAPKLENHHQLLEDIAEKTDSAGSVWADAALLALSARKDGSPESREMSGKALEHGWADAKRRVQILKAIRDTDFHGFDERVQVAVGDSDPEVAKAAAEAAKSLKLEKKGEDKTPLVNTLKPEEVVAAVMKIKGDAGLGKQLFTRQSCVTCHAVSMDEPQKGPFLGTIAQTYTRGVLAENIMDPGKTIAQGFATEVFTMKDGTSQMGFVTLESPDEVKIRNIAAQQFVLKTADIAKREKLPNSLMPPGLVSDLTTRQFASLLDYLQELSKK
ncbi:MAG: discoidin domain-containing protein [Luteolibacter sp.]